MTEDGHDLPYAMVGDVVGYIFIIVCTAALNHPKLARAVKNSELISIVPTEHSYTTSYSRLFVSFNKTFDVVRFLLSPFISVDEML